MKTKLIVALLATAFAAPVFAETVYYVDIVNTSPSDVVAFDAAPAGSTHFRSVLPGGARLQGGGESATIAIRKGDAGCRRDLRIAFDDGRVLTHRGFNICRDQGYHTERHLQTAGAGRP
jgi:hypothetical protein